MYMCQDSQAIPDNLPTRAGLSITVNWPIAIVPRLHVETAKQWLPGFEVLLADI